MVVLQDEKILSIEEQIKKLKQKKERLVAKSRTNVGKAVFETWGIEDEKVAIQLIESLKPNVEELLKDGSLKEE